MPEFIHRQRPALHDDIALFLDAGLICGHGLAAAQNCANAFHKQALRERLPHIVVGPHAQTKNFIDFIIFGCQEDHRQISFLPQPPKQFHSIHPGHLNVQNGQIRLFVAQCRQCRSTVVERYNVVSLGLQDHRHRCQDIPIIVNKGNSRHSRYPRFFCVLTALSDSTNLNTIILQQHAYK